MNGVVQEPAVSKWWCKKRPSVLFSPVPLLCDDKCSAQEQEETWLRQSLRFQSEIKWLLSLEHHRFWSQVLYASATMDGLISFLQEGLPYYALPEYLSTPRIEESYHETARLVFMIFVRLGSSNEYPTYLPEDKQGLLIRDHHIFSIPILIDLCHLYARENRRAISKIVENVFRIQPNFNQDITQLVIFLEDCLKTLTHNFCGAAAIRDIGGVPTPLALGGEHVALEDMRHDQCKDKLLYLLDAISSTNVFLDIYNLACGIFRRRHFHNKVAIFYNDVVPRMEKKLESFAANDDLITLYVDLKQKLNICKIELLRIFRCITTSIIYKALDKRDRMSEDEIQEEVEEYLSSVTECLIEHTFMQDYHNVYGVDIDLDTIAQISPDVDPVKFEYLLEAVHSSLQTPRERQLPSHVLSKKALPKQISSSAMKCDYEEAGPSSSNVDRPSGVELDSLITQVKDLLPDLGDGFIQKCLEYYNYQSDQVINAVLESSLPDHLKETDPLLPIIPPEVEEDELPKRYNVFDNDEFDIMTRDSIDMSRVHKGKRRTVPKNVFDLLNDKSDIEAVRDRYTLYGSVDTAGSMYDDEYDDTYEDQDISVGEAGDNEQRQFTVPRVLQSSQTELVEGESGSSEEEEEELQRPRDEFCQNPAELRARAEQRRQDRMRQTGGGGGVQGGGGGSSGRGGRERNGPSSNRDVVGKPKGQGQDKQVQINRVSKNTNKSSRANHNRRKGAQFKRNQGMIPS